MPTAPLRSPRRTRPISPRGSATASPPPDSSPWATALAAVVAESHWAGVLILLLVFALLVSLAVARALRPPREQGEHLGLLRDVEDASE
jgi:hypothetical protein